MPSPDLNPDWVLSNRSSENEAQPLQNDAELTAVASRLWPRVQAHARRELAKRNSDDGVVLAAEVWEGVLQSVSKTLQRRNGNGPGIVDLEAYLFGAFHHRFNRALKKERRRQEMIELVPSTRDLEQLPRAWDAKSSRDLEQSIQLKEVVQNMDDWTRRVWTAKQYGYSWREIADHVGLGEQAAKARFHNALRKLAARLGYGK
jgi:DNA-directed RNA polymerase specialized sigma24 family protein